MVNASDFEDLTGSVFFGNGIVSASGTLFILNDDISEGNETYLVNITSVFGGTPSNTPSIGSPSILELTITANDDPYGRVKFSQVSNTL